MSIFFFFMAILFSTILGSLVCILVFFALILSLIYSAPPIRLRQYIFSNLIIGACSTLAYTIGYASLFNQIDNISIPILVTIFVSISLGTVIKDLKDIKSDEKNGVSTIPIKFGKIASAFCVGLAFSLPPILLNAINFILPSFIAAIIAILIVLFNKNKTQERNFFILYYLFAIYFVYSLFFIQ